MTDTVLIAGCGYVGTALARRLAKADDRMYRVWGLRRQTAKLPQGIPGFHPLASDLGDPQRLARDLEGLPPLGAIVYAAAAEGRTDEAYRRAYPQGLRHLLEAIEASHHAPQRVLFTSSTSVFGQRGGEWVTEESPTEPDHFTGQRLLEAETVLHSGPIPGVAVRFGGIYGPGRTRLIEQVRQGETSIPHPDEDGEPIYSNRIHREDCAGVLEQLLRLPRVEPLYLAVDEDPAPLAEVYRWLADRLGREEPAQSTGAEGGRRRRSNKRCCNTRLRETGYAFQFPTFREGYGALLEEDPSA